MNWNFRWFSFIITNTIFLLIVSILNDFLGNYSIYLFPYALILYYPSIILNLTQTLLVAILSGIIADTLLLLPINTCSILFPIFATIIYCYQNNVKIKSYHQITTIIHTLNFLLFFFTTLLLSYKQSYHFALIISFLINAFASHIFLSLTTNWFIRLQQTLFIPLSPEYKEHTP